MKNSDSRLRSFAPITARDLERLLELARRDRNEFFAAHRDWAELYADRVLGTALCQGAALHYLRGNIGINDFDVYTFYASHPDRPWYAKRIKSVDFGDPKFGRSEVSRAECIGRRVDIMARGLNVSPGTDVAAALVAYLAAPKTNTARELAQKAVVLARTASGCDYLATTNLTRRSGQNDSASERIVCVTLPCDSILAPRKR